MPGLFPAFLFVLWQPENTLAISLSTLFLLRLFPPNACPSSTGPHHLSQEYDIFPISIILLNHYFLFCSSYPSWAGILTAFHITKGRAQMWSLCMQDQGALPILASSLCPSPFLQTSPLAVPHVHLLSDAIGENLLNRSNTDHRPPWLSLAMSFQPSLHLVTTFGCSSSPVAPHSQHINVMLGKHTAMYGVSLQHWRVSSKDGSSQVLDRVAQGPGSTEETGRARAQCCARS